MKDNYNLSIIGSKVTLVPYRPEHVKKYHEWMQNPEILELTASEPLTIQQEYEMQQSWANDPAKCTFILIDNQFSKNNNKNINSTKRNECMFESNVQFSNLNQKTTQNFTSNNNSEFRSDLNHNSNDKNNLYSVEKSYGETKTNDNIKFSDNIDNTDKNSNEKNNTDNNNNEKNNTDKNNNDKNITDNVDLCQQQNYETIFSGVNDNSSKLNGMAGDINLFLNDPNDKKSAEIDVMVAEEKSRRKGIAKEAVLLMMAYGHKNLGLNKFIAKIGFSNFPSQNLFKSLGFSEIERNEVFEEVVMQFFVSEHEDFISQRLDLQFSQYD